MIFNSFSASVHQTLIPCVTHFQNALQQISSWMTANLLTLNSSKSWTSVNRDQQQLAKITPCSLDTVHTARNRGFIFDEHVLLWPDIGSIYLNPGTHIRQLAASVPIPWSQNSHTIATSIVHSKLYCNSVYYNLPNTQLNRVQHIQNFLARAVIRAPKSSHINPVLKSLHCSA